MAVQSASDCFPGSLIEVPPIVRTMRRNWLSHLTVAALAIVTALFFAHLGFEEHPADCHACQIAAHAFWVDSPSADYLPTPTASLTSAPPAAALPGIPALRGAPPRGPPAS